MKFNGWVIDLSCGAMSILHENSIVELYDLQMVNFSGIGFILSNLIENSRARNI